MSEPTNPNDPTADYRKYAKGPNFLLIVLLFCITIVVVLAVAVFLVGHKGNKMAPHPPNPTPNSLVQPLVRPTGGVCRA